MNVGLQITLISFIVIDVIGDLEFNPNVRV
jgi:hypothetical protein